VNGVHDMGGLHGMGSIEYQRNEPVFHEGWESRAFALTLAMGAWGKWSIDASRHQRELIPRQNICGWLALLSPLAGGSRTPGHDQGFGRSGGAARAQEGLGGSLPAQPSW
jgi:nitrile hydratase